MGSEIILLGTSKIETTFVLGDDHFRHLRNGWTLCPSMESRLFDHYMGSEIILLGTSKIQTTLVLGDDHFRPSTNGWILSLILNVFFGDVIAIFYWRMTYCEFRRTHPPINLLIEKFAFYHESCRSEFFEFDDISIYFIKMDGLKQPHKIFQACVVAQKFQINLQSKIQHGRI